jgi:predicted DNA-binding transcriptional regulator YafY
VDANELAMDVLRQGAEVRVVEPPSLVELVQARLQAAARQYAPRT